MRTFTKVVVAVSLILFGSVYFGTVIYAFSNGLWGLSAVLMLLILAMAAAWFYFFRDYRPALVSIDEREIAVVHDRRSGRFLYYMDQYGRYTVKDCHGKSEGDNGYDECRKKYVHKYRTPTYRHDIGAFEEVKGTIKGATKTSGTEKALRTKDGLLVDVTWLVKANVHPVRATAPQIKMARLLIDPSGALGGKFKHQLRLAIAEKTVEELFMAGEGNDGNVLAALEESLKARIQKVTKALGLRPNAVHLGPFDFPDTIKNELEVVYRRKIEARSLDILRESLDKFDDSYIDRYRELERMRILENSPKHGYLFESSPNGKDMSKLSIRR